MKRHAGLKNEFCERVRTETQQVTGEERRLRQTIARQREEIRGLRRQVTQLTLAAAVLVQGQAWIQAAPRCPDNIVPLRPGSN